jgi:hypothetical protein
VLNSNYKLQLKTTGYPRMTAGNRNPPALEAKLQLSTLLN